MKNFGVFFKQQFKNIKFILKNTDTILVIFFKKCNIADFLTQII